MDNLTHARLKEVLSYDAETGVFTRAGRVSGTLHRLGYRQIGIDGKIYLAHRLAWFFVNGEWPSGDIDHANLDKDDNRIANLREVTKSENQHNRTKQANNSTGFKGVWKKRNRYSADIWAGGKKVRLGTFATPEEAHEAYKRAAANLHGTFARVA
jgi:HNH endonuclease/AP2 domain